LHELAGDAKASGGWVHEKFHQIAAMWLVGFGGEPHLHGADYLAIHFRYHMNSRPLTCRFSHGSPKGFGILRGKGQHEADGGAAVHAGG